MAGVIVLDVRDLTAYSGAARGQLTACAEAASVMLWKFHSPPSTPGRWERNNEPVEVEVQWNEPGREVIATYGNEKDATEYAAYALAMAVADSLGFEILGRAGQGTGADWFMVPKGEPTNDYYRLEVSGAARISAEKLEHRLADKIAQLKKADLPRPGVAVVARFEDVRILSESCA